MQVHKYKPYKKPFKYSTVTLPTDLWTLPWFSLCVLDCGLDFTIMYELSYCYCIDSETEANRHTIYTNVLCLIERYVVHMQDRMLIVPNPL